jgi:hypothetical protein
VILDRGENRPVVVSCRVTHNHNANGRAWIETHHIKVPSPAPQVLHEAARISHFIWFTPTQSHSKARTLSRNSLHQRYRLGREIPLSFDCTAIQMGSEKNGGVFDGTDQAPVSRAIQVEPPKTQRGSTMRNRKVVNDYLFWYGVAASRLISPSKTKSVYNMRRGISTFFRT